MLEKETSTKILNFIRHHPRTIQELAFHLQKNWRTADRYVDTLALETGLIATRTFREGTRGALKIAYWNALEPGKGTAYQERLLQKILQGNHKEDFSAFDIYQFVPEDKREAFLEEGECSLHPKIKYDKLLSSAHQQVLLFSGNLSWFDLGPEMFKAIEQLAKNNVTIKILTRVDITSKQKIIDALSINQRVGWDAIKIRHCEQPLRALLIDDSFFTIKEVLTPQRHKELKKNIYLFYLINEHEWLTWMQKIFWYMWNQSIDAETRFQALHTLQKPSRKP